MNKSSRDFAEICSVLIRIHAHFVPLTFYEIIGLYASKSFSKCYHKNTVENVKYLQIKIWFLTSFTFKRLTKFRLKWLSNSTNFSTIKQSDKWFLNIKPSVFTSIQFLNIKVYSIQIDYDEKVSLPGNWTWWLLLWFTYKINKLYVHFTMAKKAL